MIYTQFKPSWFDSKAQFAPMMPTVAATVFATKKEVFNYDVECTVFDYKPKNNVAEY